MRMNNLLIKDSIMFENVIDKLENSYQNIANIFEEEQIYIERINQTEIWTSESQKVIYKKYKELEQNYDLIKETFKIHINFLRNTLDSYTKLEEHLIQNIQGNDNLDINK